MARAAAHVCSLLLWADRACSFGRQVDHATDWAGFGPWLSMPAMQPIACGWLVPEQTLLVNAGGVRMSTSSPPKSTPPPLKRGSSTVGALLSLPTASPLAVQNCMVHDLSSPCQCTAWSVDPLPVACLPLCQLRLPEAQLAEALASQLHSALPAQKLTTSRMCCSLQMISSRAQHCRESLVPRAAMVLVAQASTGR